MTEINTNLRGATVSVPCPRECGATITVSAVLYRVKHEGAREIPIRAPSLPGRLLLHYLECPRALIDDR